MIGNDALQDLSGTGTSWRLQLTPASGSSCAVLNPPAAPANRRLLGQEATNASNATATTVADAGFASGTKLLAQTNLQSCPSLVLIVDASDSVGDLKSKIFAASTTQCSDGNGESILVYLSALHCTFHRIALYTLTAGYVIHIGG